jgi:branched-chain amino acid transport system ATP-binding protein
VRLDLAGVTAGYGDLTALREVNLTVPTGSVVALLGPNGAGKSTLLSVTSGLVRPRSGTVLLDGVDCTHWGPDRRARRGICHVTEGRAVFGDLTVRDHLRIFAKAGEGAAAAERVVDAFPRLGRRLDQQAATMSGGEQQMLALARAYVTGAPVVLLDEVSLGLAPVLVDEIFAFLRLLASKGTTLLIVEQYVSKALALADLVYLLVRGRISYAGEPSEFVDGDVFAQYLGAKA